MRRLLLFALTAHASITFSQGPVSVYDCQAFGSYTTPQELYASMPDEYHKGCVELDENNYYEFSDGDNLEITADEYISLKEGFQSGQYSDSTGMRLAIEPEELGVYVTNYADLNGVELYGKLELAVEIPQNLDALVQDFVQNGQTPSNLSPFDPEQLEIKAYFQPMYNGNWYAPFIGHGFYYEEYETAADTLSWSQIPTQISNYRIRFSPRVTGLWRCLITVYSPATGEYKEYKWFNFNVIDTGRSDFMRIGDNGRYFKIDDETFMPVGCNLTGPFDVEVDAGQTGVAAAPRAFHRYYRALQDFKNHGGNYFRFMITTWATDIEYEFLGNYTNRLDRAWEMDKLIDTLDEIGLHMHFNLAYTTPLLPLGHFFHYRWDWSNKYDSYATCDLLPNWYADDIYGYCYHSDPDYGVEDAKDFFSDPDLKRFYKNRLRYYMSRWGYSNNIGAFELMNEINFAAELYTLLPGCGTTTGVKPYLNDVTFVQDVAAWQQEMLDFIKNELEHRNQLLAVNYANAPNFTPPQDYLTTPPDLEKTGAALTMDRTYYDPNLDIRSFNEYIAPKEVDKYVFQNTSIDDIYAFDIITHTPNEVVVKPVMYSELGVDQCECDNNFSFKQMLLMSPFTGAAAGLAFRYNNAGPEYYKTPLREDAWTIFQRVREIFDGIDLDGQDYQAFWDEPSVPFGEKAQVEFIYLRSNLGDERAIGIVNNRTVNRYTMRDVDLCDTAGCTCEMYDLNSDDLVDFVDLISTEEFDWNDGHKKLYVDGLAHFTKYRIEFFDALTNNFVSSFEKGSGGNGKIKLKYPMLHDSPYPGVNESNGSMLLVKIAPKDDFVFNRQANGGTPRGNILNSVQNTESFDLPVQTEVTEVEKSNASAQIVIHPNPASNLVTIALTDQVEQSADLSVFSATGVLMESIDNYKGKISLDVNDYPKGIYFVEVRDGSRIFRSKWVKL